MPVPHDSLPKASTSSSVPEETPLASPPPLSSPADGEAPLPSPEETAPAPTAAAKEEENSSGKGKPKRPRNKKKVRRQVLEGDDAGVETPPKQQRPLVPNAYVQVVSKRLRNLRKKLERLRTYESLQEQGKQLDREQVNAISNKAFDEEKLHELENVRDLLLMQQEQEQGGEGQEPEQQQEKMNVETPIDKTNGRQDTSTDPVFRILRIFIALRMLDGHREDGARRRMAFLEEQRRLQAQGKSVMVRTVDDLNTLEGLGNLLVGADTCNATLDEQLSRAMVHARAFLENSEERVFDTAPGTYASLDEQVKEIFSAPSLIPVPSLPPPPPPPAAAAAAAAAAPVVAEVPQPPEEIPTIIFMHESTLEGPPNHHEETIKISEKKEQEQEEQEQEEKAQEEKAQEEKAQEETEEDKPTRQGTNNDEGFSQVTWRGRGRGRGRGGRGRGRGSGGFRVARGGRGGSGDAYPSHRSGSSRGRGKAQEE